VQSRQGQSENSTQPDVKLDDKYTLESAAYLNGIQALTRLLIMQRGDGVAREAALLDSSAIQRAVDAS
jgi:hypothetical protein